MLGDYTGTSTGANRVDLCRVVALRGILGRAPAKIALARDALSPVFPYVTKGDGLYADGSFVQHTWVAYSGTYGYVLLDGLGRLFTLLGGSSWEVTDPARQIVLDSVERAYAPLLHNGLMMDRVNGRAISRGYLRSDERHVPAQRPLPRPCADRRHRAARRRRASGAERDRWHAMVKGWIARDRTLPVLTDRQYTVADLARLQQIADSPAAAAPEPVGHRLFPAMDRAVHRRPGWAAGLAMASDRITYYENGNGENPRGWHTGAGMLYWWGADFGGRTSTPTPSGPPSTPTGCPARPSPPSGSPTTKAAAGASRSPPRAGSAAPPTANSPPSARTSAACPPPSPPGSPGSALADSVVCLGAGITSRDGVPAETVVDNRRLGESGTAQPSPSTASASPRPRHDHRLPPRPLGPPRRTRRLRLPRRRPPEGAARGPHRLLARHQHQLLPAALHPPLPHPLARPRHRPGRRRLRLPPHAGRHRRAPSPPAPPTGAG